MRINEKLGENFELIGEVASSTEFSITVDSKVVIVDSLINLYSKPIESIVREITSNCIDAHRERDLKKLGIRSLEEDDDLSFFSDNNLVEFILKNDSVIFKDHGVGLSATRVKDIFTVFGGSTKRKDNLEIGGFGLGSKSPFAYTNTFYVKTARNGILYTYLMSRGESIPTMDLISQEETSSKNYTEIVIPIKNYWTDVSAFKQAVYKQLTYFPQVLYKGMNPPEKEIMYEDEDCIVDLKNRKLEILIGNVQYPIVAEYFKFGGTPLSYNILNNGIKLKFDIGDLTLVPSREAIRYTNETKEKIQTKFDKIHDSLKEMYDEIFARKENETDEDHFLKLFNYYIFSESRDYAKNLSIKEYLLFKIFDFKRLQENFVIDGSNFLIDTDKVFSNLKSAFSFDKPLQGNIFASYKKYYVLKRRQEPLKEFLGLKNVNYLNNFTMFLVNFILKKYKLEMHRDEKISKAKSSTKVPLNFLTTVYENGYNGINESRTYTIDFEKLKGILPLNTVISSKTYWEDLKNKAHDCMRIINTDFKVYVIADSNFKKIEKDFSNNTFSAYITRSSKHLQSVVNILSRLEFIKKYSTGNLFNLKVHFNILDKIFNAFVEVRPESDKLLKFLGTNFFDLNFHVSSLNESIQQEYDDLCRNLRGQYLSSHANILKKAINLLGDAYVDPMPDIEKEFSDLILLYNTLLDLINFDNDLLILASINWFDADSNEYSYKMELTKETAGKKLIEHIKQRIHSYEKLYNI